jgi:hypothetical protein
MGTVWPSTAGVALAHGYRHAPSVPSFSRRTGCQNLAPSRSQPVVGNSRLRAIREPDLPLGVRLCPVACGG